MTRVIAQLWTTLDGYAAGPGGEADLFEGLDPGVDEHSQRHNLALVPACDHVLLGRRSYEAYATYWPTATETVADVVNAAPKVVASRSLSRAPWPGHPEGTVVAEPVAHLRRHRAVDGGDVLVWGSLALVAELLAAGEVDELDLFVVPLALGTGTPLLPARTDLEQVAVEDWGSVVHARYGVRR